MHTFLKLFVRRKSLIQMYRTQGVTVITLGVVLLLLGFLFGIPILWSLGMILLVIGIVLWILGAAGREIGGRRHYY
jgi:membrane protein required for beta-lactamase induction